MSASLERARLLFAHDRHDQAEREIRGFLAQEPNDVQGHYLLALCLAELERYDEALAEARMTVHLAPDEALSHYALAKVLFARDANKEAAAAITESIRLDPYDADYHSTLSAIRYAQRDWQKALDAAEAGLEIDPEHGPCLNLRAMALVKLGRKGEAGESLAVSLQKNPHNALTHANQGWTLLHERKPKEAMEHFREALRLDPTSDWAKAGILEAIKARNVVYRWMLAYFLWMGRLSGRAQWAILIGLYVANRFVSGFARQNPEIAPYLWPFMGLYAAFAVMTWLAYPIFNLMLRLHPLGKHALSREQIWGANCVGACLGLAVVMLIVALIGNWIWAWLLTLVFAALSLPAAGIFACGAGRPRWIMATITIGVALVGFAMVATAVTADSLEAVETFSSLGTLFVVGVIASGFIANVLASRS
jgi:tetratricopeptide (TPR) repeat protein